MKGLAVMSKIKKTEKQCVDSNVVTFEDFKKTKYEDRKGKLVLKNFGDTGKEFIVEYKNLSASDICDMDMMMSEVTQAKIDKLVHAVFGATGNNTDNNELLEALGIKEKKPLLLIKKMFIFERGVTNFPDNWSRVDTAKFANAHIIEFNSVVEKIWEATCMGQSVKKKQSGSGKQPESGATSQ
jgi:hypothetical protein